MRSHQTLFQVARLALVVGAPSLLGCSEEEPSHQPVLPDAASELDPQMRQQAEELAAAARETPEDPLAHARLGRLYALNGLPALARRSYEQARELAPQEPTWLYLSALERMREEGNTTSGLELLREHDAASKEYAPLQHLLGVALLEADELQPAYEAFDRAVRLAPTEPHGYVGRGQVALTAGDYAVAADELQRALEIAPEMPLAHHLLGLALRGLGREEEAQRELELGGGQIAHVFMLDSFTMSGDAPGTGKLERQQAANRLLREGRPAQALQELDRLIAEHPDDYDVHMLRANALRDLGNFAGALETYDSIVEVYPDDRQAWVFRALCLMRLERSEEAMESFERAEEIDPDYYLLHVNRAWAWLELGEPEKALAAADRAVELGPNRVETHLVRGQALAGLERLEDAAAAFARVLEIEPRHFEALELLARAELELGHPEKARPRLQTLLEDRPGYAPGWFFFAKASHAAGDTDAARAALDRARALGLGGDAVNALALEMGAPDVQSADGEPR